MSALSCPLCSVSLSPTNFEAHLRQELDYPHIRCLLCKYHFSSEDKASKHFRGPLAKHPGEAVRLSYLEEEPMKEQRLLELVRLAEGGQRAVEKRLCVCGQCRLLCREDVPRPPQPHSASRDFEAQTEAADYAHPMKQLHWTNHSLAVNQQRLGDAVHVVPTSPRQQGISIIPPSIPHSSQDDGLPVAVEEEDKGLVKEPENEASEEEESEPMGHVHDVKPALADLKPNDASDGKVACLQCNMRLEKKSFAAHVRQHHIPGKPYQCILCSFNFKVKHHLVKHQRRKHGTDLNSETFTCSVRKETVQEWVSLCFGDAKNAGCPEARCRTCEKLVPKTEMKNHIATVHLMKPLFKCTRCHYNSAYHKSSYINNHVKKVHKLIPSPDTIDASGLQQYGPIINAMVAQLFDA